MVIFLAVTVTAIHAQIKPGYIIGVNLSSMTLKTKDLSLNPETLSGIHFGGVFQIPLNNIFSLQPGLLLSAKGSNYKIDTADISISPIYFEIPVMAICSFGSDAIKISLFAGPYLACGIGGYKIISGGEMTNINFGSGENDDLRHFDAGINFGAGVNIKGLMISAQYGIGLANIAPVSAIDSEMRNKVIGISFSSLFSNK